MCPTGIVLTDSPYDSVNDTLTENGCKSTKITNKKNNHFFELTTLNFHSKINSVIPKNDDCIPKNDD